jgi:hypothetical protein
MDFFVATAPRNDYDHENRAHPGMTRENRCAKSEKSLALSTCFYLSSRAQKNNFLRVSPKTAAYPKPSRTRKEGRIAIVTDVGCGMRWTRAVPRDERRGFADGEVVWS